MGGESIMKNVMKILLVTACFWGVSEQHFPFTFQNHVSNEYANDIGSFSDKDIPPQHQNKG
jgi:hypothetical protein